MTKSKKLYKLIIDERISFTAYILADSKEDAMNKAIEEDIETYSNQDFEQIFLKVSRVYKRDYPMYHTINE